MGEGWGGGSERLPGVNDYQLNELEQKVVVELPRDFIEATGKMLRNKILAYFGVCGNKSIKAVCE